MTIYYTLVLVWNFLRWRRRESDTRIIMRRQNALYWEGVERGRGEVAR
jgi:hypothetical protein